jgi:hypothetical protein
MKNIFNILFVLIFAVGFSCSDKNNDNPSINTNSGKLGEVGNSWDVKVDGSHSISTEIIARDGDVYTLQVTYAKLITKTLKFGMSGNEIVDYVYGQGDADKPFTMVKFDAKIGDIYSTEINGIFHERIVTEKETYFIPALEREIETIGIYEFIPYEIPSDYFGYTIREIIWYWHPDYGLVCVDVYTEEGDYLNIEFISIDL